MPVTTSYSWVLDNADSLSFTSIAPRVTSLADGRVAAVSDNGTTTTFEIFNPDETIETTISGITGTNPDITQLDNGNIAVITQGPTSIFFRIFDQDGMSVIPITDLGVLGGSISNINPVVTAVAGGFQIGFERDFGTDTDPTFVFVSNTGVVGTTFSLGGSTAADEAEISQAVLNNGTIVYTWSSEILATGESSIFFWIRNADGTPISGPLFSSTIADATGSINRNPTVVALPDGGFAIIYEDNEFQDGGLSMLVYAADGTFISKSDISGNTTNVSDPEATVLDNGFIAITLIENVPDPAGGDDYGIPIVRTVDPATGQIVIEDTNIVGQSVGWDGTARDPHITTLEDGRIVPVFSRDQVRSEMEVLEAVRFTTGDNTTNVVNGDELIDVMRGGTSADFFYGLENDDRLFGGEGDDWLYGGEGDDILDGDEGADLLFGEDGDDEIDGGAGGDFIYGGEGDDILTGEDGVDWIYGEDDRDIILGQDGGDILFGGRGQDQIFGGAETDTIFGEDGDDILHGQDGGDVISGQNGNDRIFGGADGDFLFGGDDEDTIFGEDGVDQLFGQDGNDFLSGGAGIDDLHGGSGSDLLFGGDDGDSLFGGRGDDLLSGDAGGDVLNGGDEDDTLLGGADGDFLFGDAGTDTINGGTGNDQLYGGSNGMVIAGEADIFVFNTAFGIDTIHDYEVGVDSVEFEGITGLNSYADLAVSEVMGNAVVSFGMSSVTFIGVSQATLDANSADFTFS